MQRLARRGVAPAVPQRRGAPRAALALARRGVAPAVPQRRGAPRAALALARRGVAPAVPQRRGAPRAALGLSLSGPVALVVAALLGAVAALLHGAEAAAVALRRVVLGP